MVEWESKATIENLRIRAGMLAMIRNFFARHDVLEIETPLLTSTTVTDPHLESLPVSVSGVDQQPYYLQVSPEFAMKRLLASGSGPIFQICKAFRQDEQSKQHNPEFTMLEWYRPGLSMLQLMDEVEELVREILACDKIVRITYKDLFQNTLGIDPHKISTEELAIKSNQLLDISSGDLQRDEYFHLLLTHLVEPKMPSECFIYDYPADQAALAAIEEYQRGVRVAKRFELFLSGMEIANGYYELTDANEQRDRFNADLARRRKMGVTEYPLDEKLIAALHSGIPSCSGVAVGLDRLVMIAAGSSNINEVLAFPFSSV
jgi:lysyl-tRNA synthetase class 2